MCRCIEVGLTSCLVMRLYGMEERRGRLSVLNPTDPLRTRHDSPWRKNERARCYSSLLARVISTNHHRHCALIVDRLPATPIIPCDFLTRRTLAYSLSSLDPNSKSSSPLCLTAVSKASLVTSNRSPAFACVYCPNISTLSPGPSGVTCHENPNPLAASSVLPNA
jgi:hypothetical protein